jgi:hypothetical protein
MSKNTKVEMTAETAKWIEVYYDLEELWKKISENIETNECNSKRVQELMDEDFTPHLLGISYSIEKWFGKVAFQHINKKDDVIII